MNCDTIRNLVYQHEELWKSQRSKLQEYYNVYMTRYWDENTLMENQLPVETSDAYEFVESYCASLFSRAPSVVVQAGISPAGRPEIAKAIANHWLQDVRPDLERATRLALIYPNSFLKLVPHDTASLFGAVSCYAIPPWEVLLDLQASRWDDQRYVGHIYWLPLETAIARFGKKHFNAGKRQEFLNDNPVEDEYDESIKLVEFYDIQEDTVYWWSPDWKDGTEFLDKQGIPFRSHTDSPVVPIVGMYYSRDPVQPLTGYSAIARIYNQLEELNLIRSYQANAVRKAARLYAFQRGAISEEDQALITQGVDGAMVGVDGDPSKVIWPIPSTPTPPELQSYYEQVKRDKDKGNLLAPFTRGEATKATATEVTALARYTSSEIGRLARERDAVIEQLAGVYISMVAWYLQSTQDIIVMLNNQHERVVADDLLSDFHYYAEDAGAIPESLSAKRGDFMQLVGLLLQLGTPPEAIVQELGKMFSLPESLVRSTLDAISKKVTDANNALPM